MKKRNRLLLLLVLILTMAIAMTTLFACVDPNAGDDDKDDTVIETRDQLLSNGTFYNSTSSTSTERYVKDTLASWTKTSGAIGYSSAIMGAVDLTTIAANYNLIWDDERFKAAIGDGIGYAPNTPDEVGDDGKTKKQDNYAAVIASTQQEASVYYASSSSKVEKNKYYTLNIDVWTFFEKQSGDTGEGAYIFVTDGVYSEWAAIDTEGKWESRKIFIKGNNFEDRSFSVQLWLGHGPAKIGSEVNPRLTKGVALFDNVILKEISEEEYNAEGAEENVNLVSNEDVKKTSLVYPDTEFDYNRAISSSSTASSTTKSYYSARVGAPYNYTQIVGQTDLTSDKPFVSSAGNSAPYGIFDLSKLYNKSEDGTWNDTFAKINTTEFAAPNYKDFYSNDGVFDNNARKDAQSDYKLNDSRALLIFNKEASGIGYKSDKKLLIETGNYYRISVWVYVYKALMLPKAIVGSDGKAVELSEEDYNANVAAVEAYNANNPQAHVKLTGASLQNAGEIERYTNVDWSGSAGITVKSTPVNDDKGEPTGKYMMEVVYNDENADGDEAVDAASAREGYWDEVVFYIQGNSLSDRRVNLEFWLGEGTKNDTDKLVQGGAIFDSIKILSGNRSDVDPDAEYEELSPFQFGEGNDYADLTNKDQNDQLTSIEKSKSGDDNRAAPYTLSFADGVNSPDSALKSYLVGALYDGKATDPALAGLSAEDFRDWKVSKDNNEAYFNTILLRNLDYTASLLTVNATAEIRKNNYYRLSMWVKTVGIEEGQGVTINLIQRNTDSDYKTTNVLSSFTSVNTDGEWTEYVFYISGNYVDTTDASGTRIDYNAVTVQFVMGTGDSYNTSTHVKGDLIVGALNIQSSITYSEYNSASTGDALKKYAYSSNVSTENTVSGGRFNTVDYDGTVKAYNEKNLGKEEEAKLSAYDDEGNLSGIGKPSSTTWSLTNPVANQVSTPTSLKIDSEKLSWTGTAEAAYYEIFFKDTKVGQVAAKSGEESDNYDMEWKRPFTSSGTFYVRAVPKNPSEKLISNRNSIMTSTTASGVTQSYDDWYRDNKDFVSAEAKNYETNFGIVDYQHIGEKNIADITKQGNTGLDANSFKNLYAPDISLYPTASPNEIRYYFGADGLMQHLYNNVLMLSSQYKTRGGYTMYSSTSLSAESYYEISVWVKTLGNATASFTIDNSTNTFYNTAGTDYIGFNNVKTNGEWVQLKLYARTGLSSATMKLKLFMGDPYVKDYSDGEGLCDGTVFYDDVVLKKLDGEDAFNKLVEGKSEFAKDATAFFKDGAIDRASNVYDDLAYERNVYAYKVLEFAIDSFDVTTESTTTATGAKPDDYSQTILGENTTVSDAHQSKVAYGVYNVADLDDEKHAYLYENFQEEGSAPAWFGINDIENLKSFLQGFGDNVLVMANFIDNGMYYKSSNKSIKASSYYQISFYAKLKAPEGKFAEMRFYHGDDTTKYEAIKISGMGDATVNYGFVKYTLYVNNATTSSISSNYITFNLGTKDDSDSDKVVTNYTKGMLVIDNVEIREVSEETYTEAQKAVGYEDWSDDQKKTSSELVNFAKFSPQSANEGNEGETDGNKGWDSSTWLIFSTSLIGVIIVVAVAVVLIRNFRKKHVKAKAPEIESNVKVDGYVSGTKEQKKDADRREFDD